MRTGRLRARSPQTGPLLRVLPRKGRPRTRAGPATIRPSDPAGPVRCVTAAGRAAYVRYDGGRPVLVHDALIDERRQGLEHREIIAAAKGILMARRGLDEDTAMHDLLMESRRSKRSLHDVSAELVSSTRLPG
ncbi:ANTAR domain-containing protein [Arthrobacter sp. B10-11]|uniref:ANTAR domain-containing protein n=1 Tax=Arthrobacter sp. B10-11 TaxID=3081160 RepID=UPI00295395BD|nr:ANTAR domain-containing protein [Arthrobacter sp. B10-11]MDV8147558.1 ANTAR domain-containing protein [Arthrobacter sp. B10-11]